MDAVSLGIVLQNLGAAYSGSLPEGPGPLYASFIRHIQGMPKEAALAHWRRYLDGIQPCILPSDPDAVKDNNQLRSVKFDIPAAATEKLRLFCEQHSVTMPNLFQAVWGLVLRLYVGSNEICFGYILSGRETPIEGIHNAVGRFVSMSVCRLNVLTTQSVAWLAQQARDGYSAALQHQNCSLAEVQHNLRIPGERLFNTMMSVQRSAAEKSTHHDLTFTHLGNHDPTEYDMAISVSLAEYAAHVQLNHYTTTIVLPHLHSYHQIYLARISWV
ncbi:hypothetical protein BDV12DRAFT_195291 [Aspergillus spectabilis]